MEPHQKQSANFVICDALKYMHFLRYHFLEIIQQSLSAGEAMKGYGHRDVFIKVYHKGYSQYSISMLAWMTSGIGINSGRSNFRRTGFAFASRPFSTSPRARIGLWNGARVSCSPAPPSRTIRARGLICWRRANLTKSVAKLEICVAKWRRSSAWEGKKIGKCCVDERVGRLGLEPRD